MKTFKDFINDSKTQVNEARKYKFKKISYNEFERLGDSSDDYIETHIDGKSVIFITKNGNCIAMWYTNARVGSSCISFKGDELSYSEQDPNWPY